MNWTENDVRTLPFIQFEHDELGRKITGFSLFISVVCRQYKALSTEDKMMLIERIYGRSRYTKEFNAGEMARLVWKEKMDNGVKVLWYERCEKLRNRYVPGQFLELPGTVPHDTYKFCCENYK